MSRYRCRVDKDSISQTGVRATSFVIRFPRVVLAEVVTHRKNKDTWGEYEVSWAERTTTEDISKNSASSRAIPLVRMIQAVMDHPYIPEKFSAAGGGMQGSGWLTGQDHEIARMQWLAGRDDMVTRAVLMLNGEDFKKVLAGLQGRAADLVGVQSCAVRPSVSVHKQDVNRMVEPWCWVEQVVTSSAWDNFLALRCDAAAHPAFQRIARMMYLCRLQNVARELKFGQWHLPFIAKDQAESFTWKPTPRLLEGGPILEVPPLVRESAARCAWVSYANAEKQADQAAVDRTWERLVNSRPAHGSPQEHQLTPWDTCLQSRLQSNINGYLQLRKLLPAERVDHYVPPKEEIASWNLQGPFWTED